MSFNNRTFAHSLGARLIATVVVIVVASSAVIVLFGFWAMSKVDGDALARQTRFAAFGLAEQMEAIPREQESSAIWDEAVIQVRADNHAWMAENLAEWMGSYYGYDHVFVIAADGHAVHAAQGDEGVAPETYALARPVVDPVVTKLREIMAEASAGAEDSTESIVELGARNVAFFEGVPAIISARPIIPSSEAVAQAPGTEYIHVAVQYIDDTFIGEIAEKFELADAHFTADDVQVGAGQVALRSTTGETLGHLVWTPDRPGLRMVLETGVPLLVIVLVGLAMLATLIRSFLDATRALEASEERTRFLAFHDTLTGLPNRALFEDRLDHALAAVRRGENTIALLYLDLDRFKNINDTQGHPAGDELIRQVAKRLSTLVRAADTIARLGGDEFAIVQSGVADQRDAEELAARIIAALAEPFDLLGESTIISVSVGITLSFATATDKDEMLRKADIALYEAKSQGRGRYEVFAGDMDAVVQQRRKIEADLRFALTSAPGQFRLAYQPLYARDGVTVLGAEALIRWDHPVHGKLSPETYIGIAEERGLIDALGNFVLREAAATLAREPLPWLAVNVSPVQFRDPLFAEKVLAILSEAGVSPRRLQVEITESVLMDNPEQTENILKKLRHFGIAVAIDDFGTGYSSISYLHKFTVDKLKIDRSFVQQLGASEDSDALVGAMVTLARALRIKVTAEGVETADQRRHLAELGCDELQGYLMSRPMTAGQLTSLLGSTEPVAHRA